MSRSERRQYQRMMKGAESDPLAPRRPGGRGGGGRVATRNRTEGRAGSTRSGAPAAVTGRPPMGEAGGTAPARPLTPRLLVRSFLIAALVGYLAFSLAWPNMPFAVYVGAAVGAVTFLLLFASRGMQFRMPEPPPS